MYKQNKKLFRVKTFLLLILTFSLCISFAFTSDLKSSSFSDGLLAQGYGVVIDYDEEEPEEEVEEEPVQEEVEETESEPEFQENDEEEVVVATTHTPVDTNLGGLQWIFLLSSVLFVFGVVLIVNGKSLKKH